MMEKYIIWKLKMNLFFEKKYLFVLSRWNLTLGYGTIISVVKVLFHYELECPIRAMFLNRCMVKAKARVWPLLA
jgi:hypothetical protein